MEFETSEFTIAGIRVLDSPGEDSFKIAFPEKVSSSILEKLLFWDFRQVGDNVYQRNRKASTHVLMAVTRKLIEEYLGGEVG